MLRTTFCWTAVALMLAGAGDARAEPPREGNKPTVLLVIANKDFFYREYTDLRAELEKAGVRVAVAAATRRAAHPTPAPARDGMGIVTPDLTVGDADAADYAAVVFVGGWGASMYQPGFTGNYADRAYNGDPGTRAAVNRLINDLVKADKVVGGICHGVSVLAWARVNNKSLLAGKKVAAAALPGPTIVVNGRNQQPASRWHSETNGARVVASQSIGDPRTPADDVMVDGNLITAENDQSARRFGQVLGELLSKSRR